MKKQPELEELEKLAEAFWQVLLITELSDGHSKSYDPLTVSIVDGRLKLDSYVFDYEDGTRTRTKKTFKEAKKWLIQSMCDWIRREQESFDYQLNQAHNQGKVEGAISELDKVHAKARQHTEQEWTMDGWKATDKVSRKKLFRYIKDRLAELQAQKGEQ